MRSYCCLYGIVHISQKTCKDGSMDNHDEWLVGCDNMPLLFKSLSKARGFISCLKNLGEYKPIHLELAGDSIAEMLNQEGGGINDVAEIDCV